MAKAKHFDRADMIQLVNENHKIYRRKKAAFRYLNKKDNKLTFTEWVVLGAFALFFTTIFYFSI